MNLFPQELIKEESYKSKWWMTSQDVYSHINVKKLIGEKIDWDWEDIYI